MLFNTAGAFNSAIKIHDSGVYPVPHWIRTQPYTCTACAHLRQLHFTCKSIFPFFQLNFYSPCCLWDDNVEWAEVPDFQDKNCTPCKAAFCCCCVVGIAEHFGVFCFRLLYVTCARQRVEMKLGREYYQHAKPQTGEISLWCTELCCPLLSLCQQGRAIKR